MPCVPDVIGLLVVIVGGVMSCIESVCAHGPLLFVAQLASAIPTVKLEVAGVDPVGVPLITPDEDPKVAQDGSAPDATLKIGLAQAIVLIVCLYAAPVWATGRENVVMLQGWSLAS